MEVHGHLLRVVKDTIVTWVLVDEEFSCEADVVVVVGQRSPRLRVFVRNHLGAAVVCLLLGEVGV